MMNKMLMVGTGISSIGQVPILGGGRIKSLSQLIKSMFSKGEAGFAYDMSDMSTLFQDASGTIPVTAAGQPVGLILDKSKGLAYSAELFTKFDSTLSSTLSSTTTPTVVTSTVASGIYGAVINVNFMPEVYKISFAWEGNTNGREMFLSMPDGNNISLGFGVTGTYDKFIRFKSQGGLAIMRSPNGMGQTFTISSVSVKRLLGNHAYQTFSASRPILRQTPILGAELVTNGNFATDVSGWAGGNGGVISKSLNGMKISSSTSANTQASQRAFTLANKVVVVSAKFMNKVSTGAALVALWSSSTGTIGSSVAPASAVEGVLSFTVQVPNGFIGDLILQVNNSVVGNSVEFSDVSIKEITGYHTDQNYLAFDGIDDFLVTNNIDFTMTDKVSLFTGLRKLSDAAQGSVVELGRGVFLETAGSFVVNAPAGAGVAGYKTYVQGGSASTLAAETPATFPAPISNVLTMHADIANKISKLNVNGIDVSATTGAVLNGNFGNYPLYIGRRAGQYIPFTGNIYSLIGISRLTTNSETIAIEKAIAKATGVTLNV